ncbi:MAG: cytochrome c-type biogenesis protein [Rhodanobacteraceae bacterium]
MTTALRTLILALLLAVCGLAHAIEPLPFKNDAQRLRFQNLTSQLRCMVCQNEDLADSNADLARDLRHKIFDMMQAGKTDAEIKQYLVDRYSEFVLYKPPVKPGTWALWFGPAVILLLGGAGALIWLRRRSNPKAAAVTEKTDADWEENW